MKNQSLSSTSQSRVAMCVSFFSLLYDEMRFLSYSPFPLSFIFQPREYMEVAEKAASFIRKQLYDDQTRRLQHSFRNGPAKAPGFLDDYAFLISGLLDIYEFGGDVKWLVWALDLQDIQARTTPDFFHIFCYAYIVHLI